MIYYFRVVLIVYCVEGPKKQRGVCYDCGFSLGLEGSFIDNKDQVKENLSGFIAFLSDNKLFSIRR